jgi:dTDP-glucose pyrophosphorylase
MLFAAIQGLYTYDGEIKIVAVTRQDHVDKYKFLEGVANQFGSEFEWCILPEPTQNQPHTVASAIAVHGIKGQIAIKDCDNFFTCQIPEGNAIAVSKLQDHTLINPSNKSYVIASQEKVVDIVEKRIVSDTFACGMYCFDDADVFSRIFDDMYGHSRREFFISNIISFMITEGYAFYTREVEGYIDWGTIEDWNRYRDQFETLFIDLDGVLVENSGQYMKPHWGNTPAIERNAQYIRDKFSSRKVTVIITTSRTEEFIHVTEAQLDKLVITESYTDYLIAEGCSSTTMLPLIHIPVVMPLILLVTLPS